MSQTHSKHRYGVIFFWLVILTVLEVAVAMAAIPRNFMIAALLATALAKAWLIAMFFMHLKFENRLVWLLPAIGLFFAAYLLAGIFPDIALHLTGNFKL